jgi:selenophosphate synthase
MAHATTTRYVDPHVEGRAALDEAAWWSLVDPQTSGGLLLSVAAEAVDALLAHVRPRFPRATVVGRVGPRGERALRVR